MRIKRIKPPFSDSFIYNIDKNVLHEDKLGMMRPPHFCTIAAKCMQPGSKKGFRVMIEYK